MMAATVLGTAMTSCHGDTGQTYEALIAGKIGARRLADPLASRLKIQWGYPIDDERRANRPSGWVAGCILAALDQAGVDLARERVPILLGTGLREQRSLEIAVEDALRVGLDDLDLARTVSASVPGTVPSDVMVISNACAASGYALGLGLDMIESGDHDVVVVAGCDDIALGMQGMIGRVSPRARTCVRPFDVSGAGVLLGEGAAAMVLVSAERATQARALGSIVGVGLGSDAEHETAPSRQGIARVMTEAHTRAGVDPSEISLVFAHGTGTALNDPTELGALSDVFSARTGPLAVTGIKGSIGHTSGASALMSVVTALVSADREVAPPVAGLETALPSGAFLDILGEPRGISGDSLMQVDAFGLGGVNAVALVAGACRKDRS